MTVELSYGDVEAQAQRLSGRWIRRGVKIEAVYGVPRGGCVPAAMVARHLRVPLADAPGEGVLVVDDLVDSGSTAERYEGAMFDALYRKSWSPSLLAPEAAPVPGDAWVVFPWEEAELGPEAAVTRILQFIGEDPTRAGLIDTPARVIRALQEMTSGYSDDPAALLSTQFPDDYDEMVVVRGVEFHSLCEHHLLGFAGTATVAYIPSPGLGVVGLSKLARLVECYARRLQVQERMTMQIAEAIETHLSPVGVGVVVRARHSCMGCRGVRKPGAEMVTSALRGAMRDDAQARAEFLALADGA